METKPKKMLITIISFTFLLTVVSATFEITHQGGGGLSIALPDLGEIMNEAEIKFGPSSMKQEFLDLQNKVRIHAGEAPLTWNDDLENYARHYAAQRTQDCKLVHSNGPYGENIFWGGGGGPPGYWTVHKVVRAWVREHRYYDKSSNTCQSGKVCGHYTQIVWKNTEKMGCAFVECANNLGIFATCNYDPPGNIVDESPFQVRGRSMASAEAGSDAHPALSDDSDNAKTTKAAPPFKISNYNGRKTKA